MTNATVVSERNRSRTVLAKPSEWGRFQRNLAAALGALAKDQYLILSAKAGYRFVQFVRDEDGIRAEAVSNNYLQGAKRLTRAQLAALGELGWNPPTHADGQPLVPNGSPNFYRDFREPLPVRKIARVSVKTLAEVFRIRRLADLQYHSFQEPGGKDVVVPALGIDKEPLKPRKQEFEEAKAAVLTGVREASGKRDLEYNKHDDLHVHYGKTLLIVHVNDEPRYVRVFAAVAHDVVGSEALLARLNGLNEGAHLVRFIFASGIVWASSDVFAGPLIVKHVVDACHLVGDVSNDLRDELEREFVTHTVLNAPARQELKN